MPSQSISLRKLCRLASGRTASSCGGAIKLCNRCSDIRVRLEQGLPVSDEIIFLGPLKRIKDRQNCPLCRLIVKSLPRGDTTTDKGDIQCMLNPRQDCGETFALFFGNTTNPALKAWIRIECPPGILDEFHSSSSPVQSLDSHSLDEMAKRTLTIDVQKVRSWLQECENQHGVQCDGHELSPQTRNTHDMLLIDVVEDKLVDGNQKSRYIALSYVWGGWGGAKVTLGSWASSDFLRTKGAFRSPRLRLPNVLRDAMIFARSIGERYLWCDAICVFQESAGQKEQQIAQMDVIYRQALLTIVTLSGQHGDQSLPGIQGSRLPTVLVSEAGGGVRFIARAPSVTVLAAQSVYESRAWTFQEKLLSRRCLFMTEYQVFFCCSLKCYREDEDILDYPNQRTKQSNLYSHNAGLAAMLNNSNLFSLYSNLVNDYTNRNLTNSWDILSAFKGISKALEGPFGDSFIKGLPGSHFHDALLWRPQSSIQKRSELAIASETSPWIPSWSWAAYTGQICYNWSNSTDRMGGRETPYKLRPIVSGFLFIELDIFSFQGLKSPNYVSQHSQDGRELDSPGSRLFFIHFVHFILFLLRRMEEYLVQHVTALSGYHTRTEDDAMDTWNREKPRIEEFFDSHAWVFAKSPFPYMPSLDEFRYALKRCKDSDKSTHARYNVIPTDLDFWPFHCSNNDQQRRNATISPCTECEFQESLWDEWATWPFACSPPLSTLRERLQATTINISSTRGLCFWAHTLPFNPGRLQGGQLFRNSFSMSSYFTTRDGTTQCNVATLSLATDLGVSPGQEIQPATVLWNAVSEPCGIVLENEDTCISRISGRRCYLVPLSQCWFEEEELWHNYMIVAETTDGETLERIAVARIGPNKLRITDIARTLRYIQLT